MKSMTNKNLYKSLPVIFAGAILMLVAQGVLAGQTFTVTNTNDSGNGSLRQAILDTIANPGLDVIAFNISGGSKGPYTIQPLTPLPQITDPVIIDGYTQPGAAPATDDAPAKLLIELDGIMAGEGSVSGLIITAGNSTVRGLVINRFGDVGIHIQENGGNIIEGNYIGTDVTGTVDQGNVDDGIRIWDAPGNTIGGATAEARNIISGNNDMGVEIILSGSTGNKVLGNYIGTDVAGTTDLGNSSHGVFINASGNMVGDSSSGTNNVISGNGGNGIIIHEIGATENRVQGNLIGTDVTGTIDLGNSTDGVQIRSAANNIIGGTTPEARNVISGNNVRGISIQGGVNRGGSDATGNLVQGNFIGTDVTGTAALGNAQDGVQIRGAANNMIGGTTAGTSNVISGNNTGGGWGGVSIVNHPDILITGASSNLIQGNFIGTDIAGTAALGNSAGGVIIESASNNTVTDNTISNNSYGIQLLSSSDNQIYNNNFIDNTIQAYATTGRGGNILNLEKPIGGNYWSDRTSPDADDDGFVDSPYVFTGVVDYLPWARQDGWLPTPKVYYVNAVTGYDNDDGLTLQTAFATIQRGIDSAVDGDTVIVVPATYTGAGNRDLDFRGKAITVRSIDPNDQNVVETTIIDCQGKVEEPHRGFHFHSGEKLSSVLDGFTITGGFISSTTPPFPPPAGAIYCDNSSPTIANNIILNNYAANFGAIYCSNNSSPLIISNTILDNSSSSGGGGICCRGGSSPTIVNNTISGNRAGYGAGICVWSSSPTIKGNIISNNSVSQETGHSGGGIEFISFCSAVIQNNVITGNIADHGGGIAAHNSSGPIITNNTITGNTANLGGGISGEGSSLTVLNSILWNDSPDEIYLDDSSTIDITYSDIQSGWLGTGNIHADPLFVDTANADYHLQASSPCIDSGDNSAIPRSLVVDLDGNPRIINVIVDMGAYECGIAAPPPPPPPTLSEALDTDLSFTTSGNADWLSQTTTSQYGGDAAQSGDISNNQESWIQTTVNGVGTVSFYWKVSSEKDFDFLEFYIDGSMQEQISGSVNWQQKTYTISTLGSHTLEWRYVKDKGTDSGSDCGWVDKVEWVPAPPLDPLSEALDTILSFTTGGNADWFSQTTMSYYDGDAAQSGNISHNQESWLQATVSGAGTVSFYWKVSSETLCDLLEFYIDGALQDRISGSVDWRLMTYEIADSSLHTLEWRYTKDVGTNSRSDCGWVDKLEWAPSP